MQYFRRIWLSLVGLAALVYALTLVWQAHHGRGLNVNCLLRQSTSGLGASGLLIDNVDLQLARDVVGPVPKVGDRLVAIADVPIDSVLGYQRRLNELSYRSTRGAGKSLPLGSRPSDLAGLEGSVVQVGGERWVRVAFDSRRADEGGAGGPQRTWLRLQPLPRSGLALSCAWILAATALLTLGMMIVVRRPGDPSAMVFCAFCAVSVVTFLGLFHWSSLVGRPELVYPLVCCGLLLAPLLLHLYLLFPRPLPLTRNWPNGTLALVYLPAMALMLPIYWKLTAANRADSDRALGDTAAQQLHELARWIDVALAFALCWYLAGIGVLLLRLYRGRRGMQHGQVRWLLGGAVATLPPIAYLAYLGVVDRAEFAYGSTSRWMVGATWLLLVATHALGLSRYKLVSPGRLAIRALWYLSISGAATVLYCALVELAAPLAGRSHVHWLDAVVAALTALTLIMIFGWFRDRFQRGWERRYVVYKHQLDKAVRRLSEAVDHLVETSQLAKQMLQSARDVVAAERGAVYLLDPQESRLNLAARVAWPNAPETLHVGSPLTHELRHAGVVSARLGLATLPSAAQLELRDLDVELAFALERDGLLAGMLLLGPKADGNPYSSEERSFLAALARTTTLALRSAEENRTIEGLKEDIHAKVSKIAEQQQRITFLQGQLLKRTPQPRHPQQPLEAMPASEEPLAPEIRGSSAAVREMLEQVRKIAVSPSSVLIRGESGTGKELLAQAIHRNSPRANAPFVAVHCAALSPGLLEAELFGHVKGAFTGADRDRPGRFELAHGGTLLLDEIGDIALDTQIKLLRVLQERAFEPVGSSQRVQVDVRLIAATHQDLETLIRRGKFREDLFYRLNVISVRCPPLRERREDIFELAVGFLDSYAHRAGKHLVRIDEEAIDALVAYDWPGNVRELENTIERAVVLAEGESIGVRDLPPELLLKSSSGKRGCGETLARPRTPAGAVRPRVDLAEFPEFKPDLAGELNDVERQRLLEVLAECGGNKSKAAKKLGIPRSTLFSKMARLGLVTQR